MLTAPVVLLGGGGPIGRALSAAFRATGRHVCVVDRRPPPDRLASHGMDWLQCDVLTEAAVLPAGDVVLLFADTDRQPRWPWTLALDIALATARVVPQLKGRRTTLISSVDASDDVDCAEWCAAARLAAHGACSPWRSAALCRALVEPRTEAESAYGRAVTAMEALVRPLDPAILRLGEPFGANQPGSVNRVVRQALAGRSVETGHAEPRRFVSIGDVVRVVLAAPGPGVLEVANPPESLDELARLACQLRRSPLTPAPSTLEPTVTLTPLTESLSQMVLQLRTGAGAVVFEPTVRSAIPPRPARPDEVADRQQAALWLGELKHGNRWSTTLRDRLGLQLELRPDDELLLTTSGTDALRIAVAGVVGRARPGDVALLPSFTYPATADVLVQLGYSLHYVDVDPWTWTLDPGVLEAALALTTARVVVCVDTFGNPCDYPALREVCGRARVRLVADSAGALGAHTEGRPVGNQADAHAFSMSFAKVLSAGGAGGAVIFRGGVVDAKERDLWLGSALMDELHAIAALDQLEILDELVERRAELAAIYARAVSELPGVAAQRLMPGGRHAFSNWVARVPNRTEVARRLATLGIQTRDYFRALHVQSDGQTLPITERLTRQTLALPLSSELTPVEAHAVADALVQIVLDTSGAAGDVAGGVG